MSGGAQRKEDKHIDKQKADELRQKYPNHMPLDVAGKYLGVSKRRLSGLIAERRMPFALFSANIGANKQKYCRVYTERLIAYLNGELL